MRATEECARFSVLAASLPHLVKARERQRGGGRGGERGGSEREREREGEGGERGGGEREQLRQAASDVAFSPEPTTDPGYLLPGLSLTASASAQGFRHRSATSRMNECVCVRVCVLLGNDDVINVTDAGDATCV